MPKSPTRPGAFKLPLRGEANPERADAARNRGAILEAAERLFAEHGAGCVSMEQVASEAGVGKGTLFRRFGDRASLARAVLSERERQFQDELIRGAAPLGPGAPPRERLMAFAREFLNVLEAHGDLLKAAEAGARSRFAAGPYEFYRTHVSVLLHEADPDLDADYFADALLALLRADLVGYWRDVREMPLEQIADGLETAIDRLLA